MKGILAFVIGSLLTSLAAAQTEKVCEAVALFYEASLEPYAGKRAVLDTIRHRATTLKKSVCAVLRMKGQFSFVHKKFKWHATKDMLTTWEKVDTMSPVLPEAWYFNNGKRKRNYKFIRRIGRHNFYLR